MVARYSRAFIPFERKSSCNKGRPRIVICAGWAKNYFKFHLLDFVDRGRGGQQTSALAPNVLPPPTIEEPARRVSNFAPTWQLDRQLASRTE